MTVQEARDLGVLANILKIKEVENLAPDFKIYLTRDEAREVGLCMRIHYNED